MSPRLPALAAVCLAASALHALIVGRKVLLHQPVAIGARPVEDVVRVLIHVVEVHPQGLEQVLADGLRKLPAPLCVQVSIGHHIERRLLRDIRRLHLLRVRERCCCEKDCEDAASGKKKAVVTDHEQRP